MKKVIFKNKDGEIFNSFTAEDPIEKIQKILAELAAENVEGVTYESEDVTEKFNTEVVIEKRKLEYPTVEEFMDAYFDGGKPALDALKARRDAVKEKYPKPAKVK